MRRAFLVPALLTATFALAAEPAVLPEFRTKLPNGLQIVAARYPTAEPEVHMALLVPAGAAVQSSSLPRLASSVAWHRAHLEPDAAVTVDVGALWVVFTTTGPTDQAAALAERLASICSAPPPESRPPTSPPADGWPLSRDALYAALYPDHPLGNALLPAGDLGELIVRGLADHYNPAKSYLVVVGDVDPFAIAGLVGRPFGRLPVAPLRRRVDPVRDDDPLPAERTVDLPEGEPPTFLVGGRVDSGPDGEVRRATLLVALEAVRARLAVAWSGKDRPGERPGPRQLDGNVWVIGPVAGVAKREERAVLAVLDDIAAEGLSPEEVSAARAALLEERRAPRPGGDVRGFLRLLLESRLGGGVPSVAADGDGLDGVDGAEVDRLARALFASGARVIVRGK
jgi:uncharacterized membrane protein